MVLPVIAAVGAVAGGAMDYFGQRRARRRQERILNEIRGITSDQLKVNEDHFAAAFPHLQGALATAKEAGARALRMNTQAGSTASRLIGDQARGLSRSNRADLQRRGLGSTSRLAGANANVQRVAGRAIGEIGEQTGARNASIVQGTGDRVASIQGDMASTILSKGNRDIAIRGGLIDTLNGQQAEYQGGQSNALGQIGGLADLLRGSWASSAGTSSLGNRVGRPPTYQGKY